MYNILYIQYMYICTCICTCIENMYRSYISIQVVDIEVVASRGRLVDERRLLHGSRVQREDDPSVRSEIRRGNHPTPRSRHAALSVSQLSAWSGLCFHRLIALVSKFWIDVRIALLFYFYAVLLYM